MSKKLLKTVSKQFHLSLHRSVNQITVYPMSLNAIIVVSIFRFFHKKEQSLYSEN